MCVCVCVCVCVYIYIYIYIYISCMYECMRSRPLDAAVEHGTVDLALCECICIYIYIYIYIYINVCAVVLVNDKVNVFLCGHVCIRAMCIYACTIHHVYIHTYLHTYIQTYSNFASGRAH